MDYKMLDQYLEAHLEELLQDLSELIAINSERTEALEGMPFGEGNAKCSAAAMEIITKCGMAAKNYENYVVTADLAPELEKGLDILAHLDVVPAGNGWTLAEPFKMKIEGDKVYGRGTADDKGPALCALYAMRGIKELGIPMKKNTRLILGSDEECGSSDLRYYFTKETSAPYSLSPDADYPMINIEKGGLGTGFHTDAKIAEECPRILSFKGGIKGNVIPDEAVAVVEGLEEAEILEIAEKLELQGITFTCETAGTAVEIKAKGKTGHASEPSFACNAITGLLQLVAALPLSTAPIHEQMKNASKLFPYEDYHGAALGVDLEDAESGKTTLAFTICNFDEENGFKGTFDCRACLSANDENTTNVVNEKFLEAGLTPLEGRKMYGPHYVPEDSKLVQTLLDVYEDMTGERAKPLCIGGGTYVHHIENGIAFGCGFPGLDNRLHGPDEFMTIEQILFTCKIYARTILALCQ